MVFTGWPAEALDFYEGLEADNSKFYWNENRRTYDEIVLAPMQALLADLAPEFGEGKIFRPYRDVRFSGNKSPYKTNIGARIGAGYLQLSVDGLAAGSGYYHMMSDQLERYRRAVVNDVSGLDLERIVAATRKSGIDVVGRDSLKTAPRGYPVDHPRIELLRHKGLITWKEWPVKPWLGTAAAKKRVVDFLHDSQPVIGWLDAHIGPTELEER